MSEHTPIFILTSPRSYSSVISSMIGQHPELLGLPEIELFLSLNIKDLLEKGNVHGNELHGDLRAIAFLFFGSQSEKDIVGARKFMGKFREKTSLGLFNIIQEKAFPKRVVTKCPKYSSDIKYLNRLPKNSFFIHLIRHPQTHIESCKKLLRFANLLNTSVPDLRSFENWMRDQKNIITFLKDIPNGRKITLKAESVIQDPKGSMKSLCHFLNIDSSIECVEKMLHPENSPFATLGNEGAMFGNDPLFLTKPALRFDKKIIASSLENVPPEVAEFARSLGYN